MRQSKTMRLSLEDIETLELVEKLSGMKAQTFLHEYLANVRHVVNEYGHSGYRLSVLSVRVPFTKETPISDRKVMTYFAKIFSGEFTQKVNDYSGERKLKRIISKVKE